MNTRLLDIFFTFFKIGIQLIGGGYVIVPLLKHTVVDKKHWIQESELLDYYSVSQCIPGLIAANISMLIGQKTRGLLGATAAITGIVLPSFIAILLLATLLIHNSNNTLLQNAFWGVRISVLILIILTIKELIQIGLTTKFAIILYLIILFLMIVSNISPALLITASGLIGIIYNKLNKEKN